MPHPYFVAARPTSSLSTQRSGVRGSLSLDRRSPLITSSVRGMASSVRRSETARLRRSSAFVRRASAVYDPSVDPLSEVLRTFHLRASFLAAWDLGAPWGLSFKQSDGAPFHYIESGTMWVI